MNENNNQPWQTSKGQLWVVYGGPQAGKTTFALQLSKTLCVKRGKSVLYVSDDWLTPVLPVLFPGMKTESFGSLGSLLACPAMEEEKVLSRMVSSRDFPQIGVLGYNRGENCHTYPVPTPEKARSAWKLFGSMADIVVLDASSNLHESVLSREALRLADEVFELYTPDASSVSFFMSQKRYLESEQIFPQHVRTGLNLSRSEDAPVETALRRIPHISFCTPYVLSLHERLTEGRMWDSPGSGKKHYDAILFDLTERAVDHH